jgi:hypothetical protein
VNIQSKTAECYCTIVKALAERDTEFHTHKLQEERSYRAVLQNMHYPINHEDIKIEIQKLGHMVTNMEY